MAEFLESLDSNMSYTRRASMQLREHTKKIDDLLDDVATSELDTTPATEQSDAPFAFNFDPFSMDSADQFLDVAQIIPWIETWDASEWNSMHMEDFS